MGQRTCTEDGCYTPVKARGFCRSHYEKKRYNGSLTRLPPRPLADRFWSRVDQNGPPPEHIPGLDGCWLWTGALDPVDGYGRIGDNGRTRTTHRVAWNLTHGAFPPKGLCVLHRCDVRLCVRPSHLFLGTLADNTADMFSKGRQGVEKVMGSDHYRAKLVESNIPEIRRLVAAGRTYAAVGQRFGVSKYTISNVIAGRTWKQVA